MRTGRVRDSGGEADLGEHPVLGRLIPGTVMDVPDELWSDALFDPVPTGDPGQSGIQEGG